MPALLPRLRDAWAGALDLVFAPVCVSCDRAIPPSAAERVVCAVCWARCPPLPSPRCGRCWSPLPRDAEPGPVCRTCRPWPASVRAVRSAFRMAEVPRALVHALKYGGWEAAAGPMGRRMAAMTLPEDAREEASLVVPVPTGRARARERGYNQAERLAAAVAAEWGLPCRPDALVRTRQTGSQTSLHPDERRANVARAFAAPAPSAAPLRGAHVVLVDDVWTTGATALECVRALVEGGARVASVLTFARAVPELER